MKKSLLSIALMAMGLGGALTSHAQLPDEKPLLTIGCISDLHNQQSLISGSVDDVRLRGTVITTLQKMKEQENIDMLILGGDYTSDVTIPEENWAKVKDLLHDVTKDAFPTGAESFPVLYVTGNHDYEVANFDAIPKPYNAARYYDFIMKYDLGELPASECFFEEATNGNLGTMKLLAAYHYQINGFDFVVLNCGHNYFQYAWNYVYSPESVQWVSDKLDELYAADPDRTVFFVAHVPFPDSNSISNSNKGQQQSAALKKTLARHPNAIFLYGHDHGSDNAYIRTKTSQRVTRYNSQSNIISAFDDDHIDGLNKGEDPQEPVVEPNKITTGKFAVISKAEGKYLGFDGNNAGLVEAENVSTISAYNDENLAFAFEIGLNGSGQKYLHIGSNGRFSLGDKSPILLYKVKSANVDGTITAEPTTEFDNEGEYLITADYSGAYYALSSTLYSAGSTSQRMESAQATIADKVLTVEGGNELIWSFDGQADEPVVVPPVVTAKFPEGKWYQLKNQQGGDIRENSYLGYYPTTEWTIIPATGGSEKVTATNAWICPAAPFEATSSDDVKDGQLWRFIANEDGSKYCIVNKAFPNGAISNEFLNNAAANNTSRWGYVADRTASPDKVEWFTISNFGTEEAPASYLEFVNTVAADFKYMGFAGPAQQYQFMRYNSDSEAGCKWDFIAVEDIAEEPATTGFTSGKFRVINQDNGKNLGVDTQASVIETENFCDISVRNAENGTFLIHIGDHPTNGAGQRSITCSTGNRFSVGDDTDAYIYKVTSKTDTEFTIEKAFTFNCTDEFVIAQFCRRDPYHLIALTGVLYSSGANQRLEGVDISLTADETITVEANNTILWKFEGEETEEPVVVEPATTDLTSGSYYVFNTGSKSYLDYSSSININMNAEAVLCNITSANGIFNITCGQNSRYLYCGSNGRFSGNASATGSPVTIFEIDEITTEAIKGHKVASFDLGKEYLLTGVKDGTTYAVSSSIYNANVDQRLESTAVTLDGENVTVAANSNLVWKFISEPEEISEGNGEGNGEGEGETEEPIDLTGDLTEGSFCIVNVGNKGYLNYGIFNLEADIDPVASNIRFSNGAFYITAGQTDRYLYSGTGGNFLGSTNVTATYLYEVDAIANGTITGHKAEAFRIGKQYVLVGLRSNEPYAMSGNMVSAGTASQRLEGVAVTVADDKLTAKGGEELLWEFSVLPEAEPSFFSIFMGSMRYYNSIASAGSTVNDSRIAQGMMIYVYSDRIVFQIKNYAETGVISGVTIAEKPLPYTVFRTVKPATKEEVAISEVSADKAAAEEIYDVLGRRVNKADRGLYIVGGEKVIK